MRNVMIKDRIKTYTGSFYFGTDIVFKDGLFWRWGEMPMWLDREWNSQG